MTRHRTGQWALATLLIVAALWSGEAKAHFQLNINIRVIHVEHLDDGFRVYLRLPLPYLLASLTGEPRADGSVEPAPYTSNRLEQGELMHRIDLAALRADSLGLGRLVAEGHRLTVEGQDLRAEIEAVRVQPGLEQSPFATLQEARRSFDGPLYPADSEALFVGDLVVDTQLRYRAGTAVSSYAFASTLNPGLEGQEDTANLLLDHLPGRDPQIFRLGGLLDEPVEVSHSAWAAVATFVVEGIRHILEGADHLLFVLCLTIGASGLGNLLWRVTGFTVGHTVTLIVGFFGFLPAGAWFVPAVETGIALSIIYAGANALTRKMEGSALLVTSLIGLLHGLGFSFVLQEILKVDAPNLWHSLLAFNVGVELGQIAIVLVVYPGLLLLARFGERAEVAGRWAVGLPCIAVAAIWTGERLLSTVAAL